jgi:hypothetical protein
MAGKYKLKEGVVLRPFGPDSSITNENLTDAIAEHLLESERASVEDFEVSEDKKSKSK